MPMYAFKCEKCGNEYEELVLRFGEKAPCPKCGTGRVKRLVSAPAPTITVRSKSSGGGSGCSAPSGSGFR